MAIFLKTEDEIKNMREANRLVGLTLAELCKYIKPGISTFTLDKIAEEFIRSHHAVPLFKGFPNPIGGPAFPASICTSVNDCVVHGVPSPKQILKDGDIISIDCGVLLDGFCGDSAYTFCVGDVDDEVRHLLDTTKKSLYKAIDTAVAGARLGDIGNCIQKICEAEGFSVVREFTGHGIGQEMHEDPDVPNYGWKHTGVLLQEGMCLAIEPMIAMGKKKIFLNESDKWSVHTKDGMPAAHFEHTIVVQNGRSEILSTFDFIKNS